jgi:hypothetical protein
MSLKGKTAVAVALTLAAAGAANAQNQKVTGPAAEYWMSAATTSGFGMGMAGGQRPSVMGMMRGAMNPNAVNKTLTLQLGSTQTPSGAPQAEHLPPASLGAGAALPLLTPQRSAPEEKPDYVPREMQRPEGRMLIYWGCGDHAPASQPLVIDFAKLTAGQVPNLPMVTVNVPQPPSSGKSRTYGEWPNERTRTTVPANGSLIGAHAVKGNYSPEINFNLSQDFLAPLTITGQTPTAQGATRVSWRAVPNATGYFAWLMGAQGDKSIVMWTSGNAASFFSGLMDYIPPAEARRLVASGAVMSPQTTTCTIPAEVVKASPQGFLSMIAYGDEVNIANPPRPTAPAPWNISWRTKVRYKSTTGALLGMDMAAMGGGDEDDRPGRGQGQQQQQQQQRPGMGGILGGAIRGGFGF